MVMLGGVTNIYTVNLLSFEFLLIKFMIYVKNSPGGKDLFVHTCLYNYHISNFYI